MHAGVLEARDEEKKNPICQYVEAGKMIDFSLIYRTINGVIDYHPRPNYMMSIVAFDINATIA